MVEIRLKGLKLGLVSLATGRIDYPLRKRGWDIPHNNGFRQTSRQRKKRH